MALDAELVAPTHTAVVLSELQRGVVGDMGNLPMLLETVGPTVNAASRLAGVARDAGVPPEYGAMVLDNSLRLISRLTTMDDLASIWKS